MHVIFSFIFTSKIDVLNIFSTTHFIFVSSLTFVLYKTTCEACELSYWWSIILIISRDITTFIFLVVTSWRFLKIEFVYLVNRTQIFIRLSYRLYLYKRQNVCDSRKNNMIITKQSRNVSYIMTAEIYNLYDSFVRYDYNYIIIFQICIENDSFALWIAPIHIIHIYKLFIIKLLISALLYIWLA